ncbi:MAG: ribonuclease HII [bacterium]|nr:MAG: ribonuclease HII [bacterium]
MTLRGRICFEDLVCFDRDMAGAASQLLAGVDEAGRGALAGPVVAAAVICKPHDRLSRVRDSKLVSEPLREELYDNIRRFSEAVGVGIVGPEDIDRFNIFNATLKAMTEAINSLDPAPVLVLIDGRHIPDVNLPARAVKAGDRRSFSIAAASIVAKVTRDRIMREQDTEYAGYGFSRNKGYGTRQHIEAIREHGWTSIHRRSFKVNSLG